MRDFREPGVQTLIDQEPHSTGKAMFGHAMRLVLRPWAQDGTTSTRKCLSVHYRQLDLLTTEGRIAFSDFGQGDALDQTRPSAPPRVKKLEPTGKGYSGNRLNRQTRHDPGLVPEADRAEVRWLQAPPISRAAEDRCKA
ncbi:MAG: hypothetical protein JWO19_198, partial [Bryobacterales bacterium]|nr:hypothetical protein [Bryobacterales bacterium]